MAIYMRHILIYIHTDFLIVFVFDLSITVKCSFCLSNTCQNHNHKELNSKLSISRTLLEKVKVTQIFNKFSTCYVTWKFITLLTRTPPLDSILSQCSPVHTHSFQIHFNILKSMSISYKWSLFITYSGCCFENKR